jgi:hypothetical protein
VQTLIQPQLRSPPKTPTPITALDVESVRVPSERSFAARIAQHPQFAAFTSRLIPGDPKEVRRRLMAQTLRLSDSMAPDVYRAARDAQRILGVEGELEIFQRSGAENAAIHLVDAPILLEVQGQLLSLLDAPTLLGVFGHELGHYLAHGPRSPIRAAHSLTCVLGRAELDRPFEQALSRLSMLAELTADRFGLLACQDLHSMLRLEMVTLTGLSSGALTWDTEAYLAQSRDLMEAALADGSGFFGTTHPEHNLRSYALWLFSETDTFKRLTGRGPGTRKLAEVDALLGKFFGDDDGASSTELVLDYSRLGEPPRELHECALAAAVIVAHADAEMTEDETASIEHIFASLVADWRSYLDLEIALERFHELAPVLAAAGPDLTRSLFQLLVHVMGADDVVDVREVEMIIAIGRALGAEALFRRWLESTLAALKVELTIESSAPPDIPMPARREDVADAFETFLRGVTRRGETTTTLRRLLRLLGTDRRTNEVIEKLSSMLSARGIEADAELDTIGLDERITLVVPAAYAKEEVQRPSIEVTGSRAALAAALRRLREQLVSGDGRSPSVRLRRTRRGRAFDLMELERVSVGLAERVLAQVRAGKNVRVIDAASAGKHSGAASASAELLALGREDAARFEETGAHDLFVGYPFLTGNVQGYTVRAPLVLYPITIERDGPGARGFRLRPRQDEPAVANQSLIRLVFNKRGFAYSDELSDELEALAGDPDGGPAAVQKRLAEVGLATSHTAGSLAPLRDRDAELVGRGDFMEIEECAVLGLFPQSSSDLLQDYDGLLQELAQTKTSIASLLASATVLLPQNLVDAPESPPPGKVDNVWRDVMRPSPKPPASADGEAFTPVIAADPTQRRVIAECRKHGATVVDGPPGTGKSQVIVNLVAEALRRGQRVAVVCEKRAALDVVCQRLSALGFQKAIAVVHDVQEDRKPLFELIAQRLEETEQSPFDSKAADRARADHSSVERAIDIRARGLRSRPPGLDMSVGDLMTLSASLPPTELPSIAGLERLEQARLRELHDRVSALHQLTPFWKPDSIWRAPNDSPPRPSLAGVEPRALVVIERQIEKALELATTYDSLKSATPVDVAKVESARTAIASAITTRTARAHDADRAMFSAVLPAASDAPERLASADEARAAWEASSTSITRLARPVEIQASSEMLAALSVLRRWASSWLRFFVVGWWLARFAMRREIARAWPEQAGADLSSTFLDDLADRITATRGWRAIGSAFDSLAIRHLLPTTAEQLGPTISRLERVSPALRDVTSGRTALEAAGAWPADPSDLRPWDETLDARLRLLEARDQLRTATAPVMSAFPWIRPLAEPSSLKDLLDAWRRDGARVAETDALLERALTVLSSSAHLLDALVESYPTDDVGGWRTAITSAWADAWLARLEREHPGLALLGTAADDRELDRAAARLAELEEDLRELEIEHTLSRVDDAELLRTAEAEKHQRRTPAQKLREEILKETRKKRRLMPLRSFVRRYSPSGLLGVVPVWLLSPETMAILFPRQALFDLVVFDEASQCTVESGLPVLLRAKRVVIAGDEKQMPPSSYFTIGSGDDDEGETEAVEPDAKIDDDRREVRDILGAESILTLARTRCKHAGLEWHYRCRDEALIAFSNHAMYRGSLLTIPATSGSAAASPLHWVPVPDGAYDSGENRPEAERVVDVVDDLLRRDPRPSIGVVTFNLKQRKAVLDAIEARVERDENFGGRWADATSHDSMDERPFVKNLEQVQGDERDAIIFSLGHAPQERRKKGSAILERYVPARFGPLGQRGGERRLNVAISRAKSACYIVSSFDPSHLTVASSKNEGPKLFKQFLEFAHHMHHGRRLEAMRVLDLVREARLSAPHHRVRLPADGFVPIAAQIGLALEAAGIPHETGVGASSFRIPVAVLEPNDPTRFALAILIDDGTEEATAFDVHVHRRAILAARGWKVLSISAASWYRRAAEIVEQIEALVPCVRGAMQNEVYAEYRALRRRPAPAPVVAPKPATASTSPASMPAEQLPAWALRIEDRLFRRALLHLEKHGQLGEAELTNLVGGPRRARQFSREIEGWRELLPFRVEVTEVAGSKVYRNVGGQS